MASILAAWDAPASLPVLKDLMKECRARSDRWRDQENPANFDRSIASSLVEFTQIRTKLGDRAALDEYADWLRTTTPTMLEYVTLERLAAAAGPSRSARHWPRPRDGCSTTRSLPGSRSSPKRAGSSRRTLQNLFASPLIVVAGFREGVLAGLADKTPLGTVTQDR